MGTEKGFNKLVINKGELLLDDAITEFTFEDKRNIVKFDINGN